MKIKFIFKRVLIVLFVLALSFTLFACNKEKGKENTVTIKYATDGGTEIADSKVKLEELQNYELPEDPTKQGFIFDGWYLDSEFTKLFKDFSDVQDEITLYARWVEEGEFVVPPVVVTGNGLDFSFSFDLDFESKSVDHEYNEETQLDEDVVDENKVTGKATVNVKVADTSIKELADLVAYVGVSYDVEETKGEVKLYAYQGYLYASVPIETVPGADPMALNVKLELAKVFEFVKTYAQSMLDEYGIEYNVEEALEKKELDLSFVFDKLADFGIDEALIKSVLNVLEKLIPACSKEGKKYIYSITQEQFNGFVDEVGKFVEDNILTIYNLIGVISESNPFAGDSDDEEDDTYTNEEGYTFYQGENRYTDPEGVDHTFAEDVDEDFGYIDEENNVYVTYAFYDQFDLDTWELVTDEDILAKKRLSPYVDSNGNTFVYNQNYYTDANGNTHPLSEDYETQEFGYTNTESKYYYLYCFEQAFNTETNEPLTDEEFEDIQMASMANLLSKIFTNAIEGIKEMVTINKFEAYLDLSKANEPKEAKLDIDVKVVTDDDEENNYVALKFKAELKFNAYEASVDVSVLDESYVDYTDILIQLAPSLIENLK